MENCLVTKLKGTVENSDLIHFGGFRVVVNNENYPNKDYYRNAMSIPSDAKVYLISGNVDAIVNSDNTHIPITAEGTLLNSSGYPYAFHLFGTGEVEVTSKYNMDVLEIGTLISTKTNIFKEIKYMKPLNGVRVRGYDKNWSIDDIDIVCSDAGSLEIEYSNISGDVAQIVSKFPNTNKVTLFNSKVTGDFKLLGRNINLIEFSIPVSMTGTIEEFVAEARNAGRTEATNVSLGNVSNNITFEGNSLSGNYHISWTSDTIAVAPL